MPRPEVEAGVQAADTVKTLAQNYQSGLGCASAFVVAGVAFIGSRLGLPGWLLLVIILGVLFSSLGAIVFTALRDARKAHEEYMEKMAQRRKS